MPTETRDHCEGCGIPIPHVHEDADPAANLCDTCYNKVHEFCGDHIGGQSEK